MINNESYKDYKLHSFTFVFFAFPVAILDKMLKTQSRVANAVFEKGDMAGQGVYMRNVERSTF